MKKVHHIFYFLIFGLLLLSTKTDAQTDVSTTDNLNDQGVFNKITNRGAVYFPAPPPTDIEGSVYLKEEYTNSNIILKNGEQLQGLALRYNMYSEEMKFVEQNQTHALYKEKLKKVNVGGDTFVVVEIENNTTKKLKYMKAINPSQPLALESYDTKGTVLQSCHSFLSSE